MSILSKKPRKKIRLVIIGTGGMANQHARHFKAMKACELVAGVDVDQAKVAAFCKAHAIPNSFTSVKALLAWDDFDAVAVVTPDAFHADISIQCLRAKKHVLCEKPLALNHSDAVRMWVEAKKAGVIHMVNLSYRDWAALEGVAQAIRAGTIGEIRHVEASYLQAWLPSKIWGDWQTTPTWLWRLSTKHGSKGVLGDVGVHIVDFATYPAGPIKRVYCRLQTFSKAPGDRIGEYLLDANDSAVMTVEFANGAIGTIHTSRWVGGHPNRLALKIAGTKGTVDIDSDRSTTAYRICAGADLDTCTWKEIQAAPVPNNYERFIGSVLSGESVQPDFARGTEVQEVLDACFRSHERAQPVEIVGLFRGVAARAHRLPKKLPSEAREKKITPGSSASVEASSSLFTRRKR